jgi:hypothetical protein
MTCGSASDCVKCHQLGIRGQSCEWTRQRVGLDGNELGFGPIYDWSCEPYSDRKVSDQNDSDQSNSGRSGPLWTMTDRTCPKKCHEMSDCQECLGRPKKSCWLPVLSWQYVKVVHLHLFHSTSHLSISKLTPFPLLCLGSNRGEVVISNFLIYFHTILSHVTPS